MNWPCGKVLHRPGDTADAVAFHHLGVELLAQDQLGGAAADVHHQPAFVGLRQQVGHALVDQARFLAAGDHVDGKAQHLVRALEEFVAVARFAQRLGGDGAHLGALEAGQPLAEAGQAVPAALPSPRA